MKLAAVAPPLYVSTYTEPGCELGCKGEANMDLDEAVKAHAAWKMRLQAYIRAPDKSIDAAVAGRDDCCPLGQWLHGDGKGRISHIPEYDTLVSEHARFHRAVGDAVKLADEGRDITEEHVLAWDSEFAASSRNVVTSIVQIKKKSNMA
jgi:methyl-accepting chemotaxis protein